jgi:hypothetical protein
LAPDELRSQMNSPKLYQSLLRQASSTGLPWLNTTGDFIWKNWGQAEAFCLGRMGL